MSNMKLPATTGFAVFFLVYYIAICVSHNSTKMSSKGRYYVGGVKFGRSSCSFRDATITLVVHHCPQSLNGIILMSPKAEELEQHQDWFVLPSVVRTGYDPKHRGYVSILPGARKHSR